MREIKFRGKAVTGIWVYGGISVKPHGTYINNEELPYDDCCKVIPETAGQYTGLRDKNGAEIYEGDICKISIPLIIGGFREYIVTCSFGDGGFWFVADDGEWWRGNDYGYPDTASRNIEVIGNIHEKLELLKEGVATDE